MYCYLDTKRMACEAKRCGKAWLGTREKGFGLVCSDEYPAEKPAQGNFGYLTVSMQLRSCKGYLKVGGSLWGKTLVVPSVA